MTSLSFSPTDDYDLLALVADDYSAPGTVRMEDFREACWAEALAHDGWVHPSRVSARLHASFGELNARSYSAKWSGACSTKDGFLDKTKVPAPIDPTYSRGNGNKATVYRRWRGWSA